MATENIPKTMRAWQYTTTSGGLEKNLKLNPSAPVPTPKPTEHLVKVIACALNPVDYKPAENGLLSRLLIPKPATPGIDVCARIVKPASGSGLSPGQIVFGAASKTPFAGGALAEYAAVPISSVLAVPKGLSTTDAAGMPVVSLTASQSILPHMKSGDRIFLNGGSGGTGTWGIQVAKEAGARVTVSCSTPNVALCKSLGADQVLDYKQSPILQQLQESAKANGPFDLVVDNVWADPNLYWQAHTYTKPKAIYMNISDAPTMAAVITRLKIILLPGLLGGGQRKFSGMLTQADPKELARLGNLVAEGKIKTIIDSVVPFEQAVEAFQKLKTWRARGKIVIQVEQES